MKFRFEPLFLAASLIALLAGLILFFFSSGSVRFYLGDAIAVFFLFTLLSSFLSSRIIYRVGLVLILALLIELLQSILVVPDDSWVLSLLFGSRFDYFDVIAYIFGLTFGVIFEKVAMKFKKNR